jgi:DNA-binding MarR family transcriptional regulator
MMQYEAFRKYTNGDKDYELWMLLVNTKKLVFRARELELSWYGLTPEQSIILCIVHNSKEALTPAEIARLIICKPNTVSAMMDRMAEKGLIKKTVDPRRKNMVRIMITEKGKKAYEAASKRDPIHRIMGYLPKDEQVALSHALGKIAMKTSNELGITRKIEINSAKLAKTKQIKTN